MFHSKSIIILQKWDGSNGKINMQAVGDTFHSNAYGPWTRKWITRSLWRVASATLDPRLPSQP